MRILREKKRFSLRNQNIEKELQHPNVTDEGILYSIQRVFIKNVIILSVIGQTSSIPTKSFYVDLLQSAPVF